jgi:hypothetical protein
MDSGLRRNDGRRRFGNVNGHTNSTQPRLK